MSFTSPQFFIFIVTSLLVYHFLSHKYQNIFLLVASYFFYCQWDYSFSYLMAATTLVVFIFSHYICNARSIRKKSILLAVGVTYNVLVLGYFKYYNFFLGSISIFLERIGFNSNPHLLKILVPVGLSFYIFQTISYLVDVYKGKTVPESNLLNFALYVAFFPKLLTGPIERAEALLPQIRQKRTVDANDISQGIVLILYGLVKKVAVADVITSQVDIGFNNPAAQSSSTLLLSAYLYSILIYCDFSGYTDLARGISKLFGINLSENFSQPYFSSSIREFWRRWHITLSTWLRDYLYIPLDGSRRGVPRTILNLMITMLLGGLWHGANWTFVFWGGAHGLMLAAEHVLKKFSSGANVAVVGITRWKPLVNLSRLISIIIVFNLVTLAWVFFRAESFSTAFLFLKGILMGRWQADSAGLSCLLYSLSVVLAIDMPQYLFKNQIFLANSNLLLRGFAYALMISLIIITWSSDYVPFIYSQF